jgi:hypothetical protein
MSRNHLVLTIATVLLTGCSGKPEGKEIAKQAVPAKPVKITQLYASPPNPPPGQKSMVCYSTENATAVEIDPPNYPVWPSPSRCFEVFPKKKLTLKLTARRDTEEVVKMVTVAPGPPPAELIEVRVDALEVPVGTPLRVCYTAKHAASVSVTPGEYIQHEPDHGCVQVVMEKNTRFAVRVRDRDGDIVDGEDVEVRIKR